MSARCSSLYVQYRCTKDAGHAGSHVTTGDDGTLYRWANPTMDDARRAAERIVRDPPIRQIAAEIHALASAVYERTGRHGVTRISLTPDVGLSFGIAPGTSLDVATSAGRVEVYAEATPRQIGTYNLDAGTWTLPVQIDPTAEQVRAFADSLADYVPRANARIAALEHELAKVDRRSAEQERIITAYREDVVAKLRAALTEALDAWAGWAGRNITDEQRARIAELRKLTEAP